MCFINSIYCIFISAQECSGSLSFSLSVSVSPVSVSLCLSVLRLSNLLQYPRSVGIFNNSDNNNNDNNNNNNNNNSKNSLIYSRVETLQIIYNKLSIKMI